MPLRVLAVKPVKRPAVEVHHGFKINGVYLDAINDSVGKAVEVELAILTPDFTPAIRIAEDAVERSLVFLQKVASQSR